MNQNLDMNVLKKEIMQDVYQNRMLLTSVRDRPEGWTLISGRWSPFYIQLRLLSSFPATLKKIGVALSELLEDEAPDVTRVVGIAHSGVPIATALSLESGIPACHTRKIVGVRSEEDLTEAIEEYGQHALLEGIIEDDDVLCIVDDLVTGMTSKLIARKQILSEMERRGVSGAKCDDILVVIDRQQGARTVAKEEGLNLHSLIDFADEGLPMLQDLMGQKEYETIIKYLKT
jgi:orotate phosphoribosyltransferase